MLNKFNRSCKQDENLREEFTALSVKNNRINSDDRVAVVKSACFPRRGIAELGLVALSFFVPQAADELACHFNVNRKKLTENQNQDPRSY